MISTLGQLATFSSESLPVFIIGDEQFERTDLLQSNESVFDLRYDRVKKTWKFRSMWRGEVKNGSIHPS